MGKVPKAFKIIPNLKNWEVVLWMTEPDNWSPHAMYEVCVLCVCVCCVCDGRKHRVAYG